MSQKLWRQQRWSLDEKGQVVSLSIYDMDEKKPSVALKPKDTVIDGPIQPSPNVTIQGPGIPTPNGVEDYYSAVD
jgi:hypothetical protein